MTPFLGWVGEVGEDRENLLVLAVKAVDNGLSSDALMVVAVAPDRTVQRLYLGNGQLHVSRFIDLGYEDDYRTLEHLIRDWLGPA